MVCAPFKAIRLARPATWQAAVYLFQTHRTFSFWASHECSLLSCFGVYKTVCSHALFLTLTTPPEVSLGSTSRKLLPHHASRALDLELGKSQSSQLSAQLFQLALLKRSSSFPSHVSLAREETLVSASRSHFVSTPTVLCQVRKYW